MKRTLWMKRERGGSEGSVLSCVGLETWFSLLNRTVGKLLYLPLVQYPHHKIGRKVKRVNLWKAFRKVPSTEYSINVSYDY